VYDRDHTLSNLGIMCQQICARRQPHQRVDGRCSGGLGLRWGRYWRAGWRCRLCGRCSRSGPRGGRWHSGRAGRCRGRRRHRRGRICRHWRSCGRRFRYRGRGWRSLAGDLLGRHGGRTSGKSGRSQRSALEKGTARHSSVCFHAVPQYVLCLPHVGDLRKAN